MPVLHLRALVVGAAASAVGVFAGHLPPCTGDEYDRIVGGCDAKDVDLSSSFSLLLVSSTGGSPWNWRGCGAVLITPRHILSAAHCDHDTLAGAIVNTTVLALSGSKSVLVKVARKVAHPAWGKSRKRSDFLLLELEAPVPAQFAPHQLQLATAEYESGFSESTTFVTCGFGREDPNTPGMVNHLACVRIPHKPTCSTRWGRMYDASSMICAGAEGMDSCMRDSGGPLLHKAEDGKWTLTGIVSFGRPCAVKNWPSIYARVSSAIDWLRENGVTGLKLAPAPSVPAPPTPAPAPAPAPAQAPSKQEIEATMLDTLNRLRCLHWSTGGGRWAANLTWSSTLAALASRPPMAQAWGDDRGVVDVEMAPSLVGSVEDGVLSTYKTGLFRTDAGKGEKVAEGLTAFQSMVQTPDNAWKEMRQYTDIVWRGSAQVGCAKVRQTGEVHTYACTYSGETRLGMTVRKAWEGISAKEQISAVTNDPKVAEGCGLELGSAVTPKTYVDTEGIGGADVMKDAACAARSWLATVLLAVLMR